MSQSQQTLRTMLMEYVIHRGAMVGNATALRELVDEVNRLKDYGAHQPLTAATVLRRYEGNFV